MVRASVYTKYDRMEVLHPYESPKFNFQFKFRNVESDSINVSAVMSTGTGLRYRVPAVRDLGNNYI